MIRLPGSSITHDHIPRQIPSTLREVRMAHASGRWLLILSTLLAAAISIALGFCRATGWIVLGDARAAKASAPDSRRQLLNSVIGVAVGSAAGELNEAVATESPLFLSVKLYSDTGCTRQFKKVDNATVTLGKCEYSADDGVSVLYECLGGSKLNFKLFFKKTCDGTPSQDVEITNGQCTELPRLGSGLWTWTGGCV